ncbi:hypothetical protein BSIN_0716 [Burkholderia singularis]|uniref:Uncharacterized protein n=1 Tax=Burkholderia singularis TaxID=1503053 RepID=A0A238H9X3_9BURK|nr:hypothetical protein BSIN_0716 [Burkholderia singularis]
MLAAAVFGSRLSGGRTFALHDACRRDMRALPVPHPAGMCAVRRGDGISGGSCRK